MIRLALFAFLSAPILWVSRRSLRHPRSHGFFRFFAFESILALMVLSAPRWFAHPLATWQILSWGLLSTSLVLVVWGFLNLRGQGGFRPGAEVSTSFAWENTGRLVTTGIYRYIRHPMYASLLFLAWGTVLKTVSPATLGLGAVASLALAATAKAEEAENVARFGQEYRDYMARTRRFVPFFL